MNQFKSGDCVVVTKSNMVFEAGEKHILKRFELLSSGRKAWFMEGCPDNFYVQEIDLRLQTPKEMLKNGMRVKCRNGSVWTYIDGYFTQISQTPPFQQWLSEIKLWEDDLSHFDDGRPEWDVMEISEAPHVYYYFAYSHVTPVIWKREEKTEAEKQLEEIQASIHKLTEQAIELGKQIKQEKL